MLLRLWNGEALRVTSFMSSKFVSITTPATPNRLNTSEVLIKH